MLSFIQERGCKIGILCGNEEIKSSTICLYVLQYSVKSNFLIVWMLIITDGFGQCLYAVWFIVVKIILF